MIVRLFFFLLGIMWRILSGAIWLLSGALLSALLRLSPHLFRLCVLTTAWTIDLMDKQLKGRLVQSAALTILAGGSLWAFFAFFTPFALGRRNNNNLSGRCC